MNKKDGMKQMCRNGAFAFFEAILCVGPDFIASDMPEEVAGVFYFLRTEYQHLEVRQWPPSICLRKIHFSDICLIYLVYIRLRGLHGSWSKLLA